MTNIAVRKIHKKENYICDLCNKVDYHNNYDYFIIKMINNNHLNFLILCEDCFYQLCRKWKKECEK